jgi:hypothetical protein
MPVRSISGLIYHRRELEESLRRVGPLSEVIKDVERAHALMYDIYLQNTLYPK